MAGGAVHAVQGPPHAGVKMALQDQAIDLLQRPWTARVWRLSFRSRPRLSTIAAMRSGASAQRSRRTRVGVERRRLQPRVSAGIAGYLAVAAGTGGGQPNLQQRRHHRLAARVGDGRGIVHDLGLGLGVGNAPSASRAVRPRCRSARPQIGRCIAPCRGAGIRTPHPSPAPSADRSTHHVQPRRGKGSDHGGHDGRAVWNQTKCSPEGTLRSSFMGFTCGECGGSAATGSLALVAGSVTSQIAYRPAFGVWSALAQIASLRSGPHANNESGWSASYGFGVFCSPRALNWPGAVSLCTAKRHAALLYRQVAHFGQAPFGLWVAHGGNKTSAGALGEASTGCLDKAVWAIRLKPQSHLNGRAGARRQLNRQNAPISSARSCHHPSGRSGQTPPESLTRSGAVKPRPSSCTRKD